jgi:hypothetical protein
VIEGRLEQRQTQCVEVGIGAFERAPRYRLDLGRAHRARPDQLTQADRVEVHVLVQLHRLDPHIMAAISFADDQVRHHRISARPASVDSRDAPGGAEIVFRATIEVVGQAAASGPLPAVVRDHPPIRTPLPDEEPQ